MQYLYSDIIEKLKQKSGLSFRQSKDYAILSGLINKETGEMISDNTLRRLMGVKNDAGEPRLVTLDIVARYLGSANWNDLVGEPVPSGSGFRNHLNVIKTEDLAIGQCVEVQYVPARTLKLRVTGKNSYVVEECTTTNLKPGDTLYMDSLAQGQTMFVSRVDREGKTIGQYVAGEIGGLTKVIVEENL